MTAAPSSVASPATASVASPARRAGTSLRRRTALAAVLGTLVAVTVGGVAVWSAARALAWRDLDLALQARANQVVAAIHPRPPPRPGAQRGSETNPRPPAELLPTDLPPGAPDEAVILIPVGLSGPGAPVRQERGTPPAGLGPPPWSARIDLPGWQVATLWRPLPRGPGGGRGLRSEQPPELDPFAGPGGEPFAAGERGRDGSGEVGNREDRGSDPGGPPDPSEPRAAATPGQGPGLWLAVARPTAPVEADLARLALLLLAAGIATTAGSAAIAWFLAGRALAPAQQLATAIAAVDPAAAEPRLDLPDSAIPAELAVVADRLDGLLRRVDGELRRERRLGAHLAHELRTPVASLLAVAGFALHRARDPQLDARDLTACRDLAKALGETVESLLLLNRLERGMELPESGADDLGEIVSGTLASLRTQAEARQQQLVSALPADLPTLLLDRRHLGTALRNLVANASSHGAVGGTIEITAHWTGGWLELRIANPVAAAAADAAAKAAAGEAQLRQAHTGLGLPLCRRLAELLGGTLTTSQTDGRFIATLGIPVVRA